MSRSRTSGAVAAPTPEYRHPLLAAFSLFLAAPFFTALPGPPLRRWSLRTLAFTALVMALGPEASLARRFRAARGLVHSWRLHPLALGQTYQGWGKALAPATPRLLRALTAHLRTQIPALAGQHWKLGRWVVLGVDGSKFDLPRTAALEKSFGCCGKKSCGPQAFLTTILHLTTGLPWAARIGRADSSERHHLRRLLRYLPPDALLVADAGFVGYDLWRYLIQQQVSFLIRVGANVRLLTDLGWEVRAYQGLVYLWPADARRRGDPPLVLRLIRVRDGRNREMCLVTNVLETEALSETQAVRVYRLRWGIELWFRQMKQTAGRRRLASAAAREVTVELAWLVVALAVQGMAGVQEAVRRGQDPLRLSPAALLGVWQELARQPQRRGGRRTLRRCLGPCLKDGYTRRAPKVRQPPPAKKRDHPPGLPKITPATAAQVAAAATLKACCPLS